MMKGGVDYAWTDNWLLNWIPTMPVAVLYIGAPCCLRRSYFAVHLRLRPDNEEMKEMYLQNTL
jgi:hypothetical protein